MVFKSLSGSLGEGTGKDFPGGRIKSSGSVRLSSQKVTSRNFQASGAALFSETMGRQNKLSKASKGEFRALKFVDYSDKGTQKAMKKITGYSAQKAETSTPRGPPRIGSLPTVAADDCPISRRAKTASMDAVWRGHHARFDAQ